MSDAKLGIEGSRGPRGERGERGRRGHDGHDGSTGPTGFGGSTGTTGFTGPTGPTGDAGVAPVIAAANVNSTGVFISQQGFAGIVHLGVGQYDLTLTSPPANLNNIAVEVTQGGSAAGQEAVTFSPPNHVVVLTFNAAGAAADRVFMVVVHDLT